jgi:hypothetical protein
MNITDLIVEFIKEGNVVEFPGMGTLTSSTVSAHHDAASGTYYPARRTVVMNNTQSGNQAIIRKIAESECVTVEIAEMMWKNYVGALNDKLQRDPKGHEFSGIGTMHRMGNKVVFDAKEGLDLDADKRREQPLENVATYTPKNVEDPFAAFEKPAEPSPAPEPVPAPAPAPAPKPEPKPEPKVVEPTPAPEPKKVEEPTPKPVIEPVVAAAAAAATTAAASASAEHLSEVKKMLDEIPASPKTAKEARRAEKAAAKAEKEARKAAEKAEKETAKKAALLAKEKEAVAKEADKALRQREKAAAKAEKKEIQTVGTPVPPAHVEDKEKKEKKRGWLWIVLLLLLALIGCAIYYFINRGGQNDGVDSYAKEVNWSRYDASDLLPMGNLDMDMLNLQEFDENRIANTVNNVHVYMSEYIHNFLLARHYSNAFAPMMNSIDQYANERLHELMVPGMSTKRFHPYNDFWMNSHLNSYKAWGSRYYQYKVQGELMDVELLENILDDLVVRLGLHADGFGLTNKGAAGKDKGNQYKSLVDRPFEETVPEAPTFRNSKQGYDIIAGFATDKKKANKLANQLKKLGSDAYIISKSGGYYISMGSAPTLTAAQAMENHIKGWYQGPVSIKNFNE